MAQNKTYYGFAKWFRRCSLIILAAPVAVIICYAILLATNSETTTHINTQKAVNIILWINFVAGILWFILAIIMFFTAGTVRGQGASPLGIRIGIIIALALVLAELILSIVFQKHPDLEGKTWVWWVELFMPLINIIGYAIGAKLGKKVKAALA